MKDTPALHQKERKSSKFPCHVNSSRSSGQEFDDSAARSTILKFEKLFKQNIDKREKSLKA